jgi:hypothetical protein
LLDQLRREAVADPRVTFLQGASELRLDNFSVQRGHGFAVGGVFRDAAGDGGGRLGLWLDVGTLRRPVARVVELDDEEDLPAHTQVEVEQVRTLGRFAFALVRRDFARDTSDTGERCSESGSLRRDLIVAERSGRRVISRRYTIFSAEIDDDWECESGSRRGIRTASLGCYEVLATPDGVSFPSEVEVPHGGDPLFTPRTTPTPRVRAILLSGEPARR